MILQNFFYNCHKKKKENSKPSRYVDPPLLPTTRFLIFRNILKLTEVSHTSFFFFDFG